MRDPSGGRAGFARGRSTYQNANGTIRLRREHAGWIGITSLDVDRPRRWVGSEDEARVVAACERNS